jgi:hypothetical protein
MGKGLILIPVAALIIAAAPGSAGTLEGTVQKIDPAKKEIVLNTESGAETVAIGKITKGVKKVRVGDSVTIIYNKEGEKLEAITIDRSKPFAPIVPWDLSGAARRFGGAFSTVNK